MDTAFYGIQDFAVQAPRGTSFDVSKLPLDAKTWLGTYVFDTKAPPKSNQAQIITSLVSRVVVECFDPKYFFGASSTPSVNAAMSLASAFTAQDPVQAKAWLVSTHALLFSNDTAMRESEFALITSAVQDVRRTLSEALPIDWEAAGLRLRKALMIAFHLAKTLHRAKALFHVEMAPAVRDSERLLFQPDVMLAVNSVEYDSELVGRPIAISVFPGVYKFGDEMGEKRIMSQPPFDTSHDFSHIQRVVELAERLAAAEQTLRPDIQLDLVLVTLTALLHDIGDSKYILPTEHGNASADTAESILLSHAAPPPLASKVQTLVSHVSCSYELAHPLAVEAVLVEYPELAVVQDADRLDAIGAVGIGRAFTYGGAHGRTLAETRSVFEGKLLMREGMMRTAHGKQIASERCRRLLSFMGWWDEELSWPQPN
ncbi:hypothetical protein LTR65_004502 [Meristemomyces frigidus]